MLIRLRKILGLLLAAAIGYALATGAIAEYVGDLVSMVRIGWAWYRLGAGSGGTVSILIAGFLLGQGLFLAVRQIVRKLGPKMIEWAEQAALWDPALLLPSRFGLQRYLNACVRWAGKESPDTAPSVALFKISGLGQLNDQRGTHVATELLRHVAQELRDAALPPDASPIRHFLAFHFPRPPKLDGIATPPPRCPGRWSGSTLALAFRGLEAHQSVTLAKEFADWLRGELAALGADTSLELSVAVACARPGAVARSIGEAAAAAIAGAETASITVALDPADRRAAVLTEMPGVRVITVAMDRVEPADAPKDDSHPAWQERSKRWMRGWGLVLICVAAAPMVLVIGSGPGEFVRLYPWPANLTEVPVVGASGVTQIKLVRTKLAEESMGDWKLSGGELAQAEAGNKGVNATQIWVEVTNLTNSTRYVSAYDFKALDANGRELPYLPRLVIRYEPPLDGKWLRPRQTWSGWLVGVRDDAPVTALVFRPDRETRIVSRVVE